MQRSVRAARPPERARELVDEMQAAGIPADAFILNTLLGGYAKQLRWTEALRTFNKLTSGGTAADLLSTLPFEHARARSPRRVPSCLSARAAGFAPNARMYTLLRCARAGGRGERGARAFSADAGEWSATDAAHLRRADGGVHRRPPAGARAGALRADGESGIAADVVTHTLAARARDPPDALLA